MILKMTLNQKEKSMTAKKKSVNGKQKGSEFERYICKTLSGWASYGKRDDLYWRSAMSGGRATVQFKKNIKNTSQVADISCIDSAGEFLTDLCCIECKIE